MHAASSAMWLLPGAYLRPRFGFVNRSGLVKVRPHIHPGHINIEIWNIHPDHNQHGFDIADALRLACCDHRLPSALVSAA